MTLSVVPIILGISCAADAVAADVPPGVVHWQNGDQLPGQLLGSDGTTLRWQSEWFTTPFDIHTEALSRVRFTTPAPAGRSDLPFRVVTVNNDVLQGQLVDLNDRQLIIFSPRHGEVRLERSRLIGMQRHNRRTAGSVGLGLLIDWTTVHRGREISEWSDGADGRIQTKVTGAELYRDLHLTSLSEIELALSWRGKPGFVVSFAAPDSVRLSKNVVKLETWGNDLVLQTLGLNGDFEVIRTIPDGEQTLELRLQWDPADGELSVCSPTGQLLGRMKGAPKPSQSLSGLYLQNKGAALSFLQLRANRWEGAGEPLPDGAIRVRLANAESVIGRPTGFDASRRQLSVELKSGASQNVALDRINSLETGNQLVRQRAVEPSRVTFVDGTQISGIMESIRGGVLTMKTSYCAEPINTRLDGIMDLRFAPSAKLAPPRTQRVLHLGNKRLRGQLVALKGRNNAIGWRPIGGVNASELPVGQPLRIMKSEAVSPEAGPTIEFPDRIFLRNGDAVPCAIRTIDATHLNVAVPLTKSDRIDRSMVIAVEFGSLSDSVSRNFADPRWFVVGGDRDRVTRSDDQMVVHDAATICYDNIRDVNEISFDVQWNMLTPTLIRVILYTDGPNETRHSRGIMIYRTNSSQVMIQATEGADGGRMVHLQDPAHIRADDGRNSIRMQVGRRTIGVYEREKELLRIPFNPKELDGTGLTLQVQQLGNAKRLLKKKDKRPELLALSNMSLSRSSGNLKNLLVEDDELERLLTIPRFRKQSPTSEILVGHNGDRLRGRLVSLDEHQVTFVSRLDTKTFPRHRLAGIIWPQSEQAVQQTARADPTLARILLTDGSVVRMTAEQLVDDALVGQHPALGRIAIPVSLTRELAWGTTVARAHGSPFSQWKLRPAAEPKFAATGQSGSAATEHAASSVVDSPLVGQPSPKLVADSLDGSRIDMSQFAQKVIVLEFWASWCGPCVRSLPVTMKAVADLPANSTVLLTVNQLETPATIRQFLNLRDWDPVVLLDPDGRIGKLFHVEVIPQIVVIDTQGQVHSVLVGERSDLGEQLKRTLTQLTSSE